MIDDPWVRDPGWEKVSIRIQDELRNHLLAFWGLKYLNSLMLIRDPESGIDTVRIRDGKKRIWDPGPGINIWDPQH